MFEVLAEITDRFQNTVRQEIPAGSVTDHQEVRGVITLIDQPCVFQVLVIFKQQGLGGGIDFQLAAYLSLGKHWKKISKTQKKEFVETFQLYINNYIVEKIDLYTNQKIDIGDSKIVKKGRAELEIGILSGGETLQVNFKLRKNKKKEWRVYDVDIEGVSLITTFRSQFSGVLKKKFL